MPQVNVPITSLKRRRTRTYDTANDDTDVLQAIVKLLVPTATLIPTLLAAQPADGWLLCNGQAVLKADYPALFAIIGNRYGETATTFTLPDLRGRMPIGSTGALSLFGLGGAASVTLTVDQLPSHGHGILDPGHGHDFTAGAHTHTVTDPGHVHTVTDPGHAHTAAVVAAGVAATGAAVDGAAAGNTGTATTGVTVASATTGVTLGSATITGDLDSATTGITVQNAGGGQAVPTLPPYVVVNWMVRT